MIGRKKLNAEAQRTQSLRAPFSVNSVPLCFKNTNCEVLNSEAVELEERIANNVAKLLEEAS